MSFSLAREIDGVVERRAAAGPHALHALFELAADRPVRSLTSSAALSKLTSMSRSSLRTHHALDETNGRLLLEAELFADAVAGIDQHREAQRQIGFRGELLDDLRLLVLDDVEIGSS